MYWLSSQSSFYIVSLTTFLMFLPLEFGVSKSLEENSILLYEGFNPHSSSSRRPAAGNLHNFPTDSTWKWRGRNRRRRPRRNVWQNRKNLQQNDEFSYLLTTNPNGGGGNPYNIKRNERFELLDEVTPPGSSTTMSEGQFQDELPEIQGLLEIDECCPTVPEIVAPLAGKNRSGDHVELYHDENVKQHFYEISCHPSILNKPCKYLDKSHNRFSRCVQQHSYTYALVRVDHGHGHGQDDENNYLDDPHTSPAGHPGGHRWALDYISVRSGCSCKVIGNARKRRKLRKNSRKIVN